MTMFLNNSIAVRNDRSGDPADDRRLKRYEKTWQHFFEFLKADVDNEDNKNEPTQMEKNHKKRKNYAESGEHKSSGEDQIQFVDGNYETVDLTQDDAEDLNQAGLGPSKSAGFARSQPEARQEQDSSQIASPECNTSAIGMSHIQTAAVDRRVTRSSKKIKFDELAESSSTNSSEFEDDNKKFSVRDIEEQCNVVEKLPNGEHLDYYLCNRCNRTYKLVTTLYNHLKYTCGREPTFKCNLCPYSARLKGTLIQHKRNKHTH